MDSDDIDWNRLDRYVSGQGTPDELAELERWVNAEPELRALAEVMRTAGRPSGRAPRVWDVRAAWQRVHGRMRWVGRPPLRLRPEGVVVASGWHRPAVWRVVAAAAAVLLLALGSSLLFLRSPRTPTPNRPVAAAPMREVATRRGERAVFNLADGSRVMLAAESRLRIPAGYNSAAAGGRPLYLAGEAYFTVRHDSTRPFRVHTTAGIAEDLGTEFAVTAYPETPGMRVVVASGAVALRSPARSPAEIPAAAPLDTTPLLTLAEGDLARIDTAGVATLTRVADIRPYLAWTEGVLVFDGTRLGDALPQIGRWYDLDIRLADPALSDRRLTATFRNEAAPQVLERIALALDLQLEQSGRAVTLAGRRR